MNLARYAKHFFASLTLLSLASVATAESRIEGVVKDSSGAVMAGVQVEAFSPALIEKSRTVTTDGSGRYTIVDLRLGTYVVTFTMPGFKTQKRDGVEVSADTSVTLFVEMGLGSVGETVEVQATAPVVDVENAATHQILTRDIQDAIPAPRNMQALGGLTPGIQLHSGVGANPDVGGSQQMEQTYITGHGNGAVHTTVLIDGMNINSNYLDGTIQNYVDNAIIQQSTYQTSGFSAEVASGGTLVNQVPKDGGNSFHGDFFLSGTGSNSFFQANNLTQSLKDRGVKSVNGIQKIEDFDGDIGGPILKDRLWFLAALRYQSTYDTVANVFYPNGAPGVEEQSIKQGVLRLAWQISSKDKFSGTYDRIQKFKGHELSSQAFTPIDPATAASRRGPPLYYVAQGKWTRIQSPRMLFEAGFSTDIIHFSVIYLPGEEKTPFSPEWYALASRQDTILLQRSNAPPLQSYFLPDRRNLSAAVSYITGSHNIKFGVQDAWGKNDRVSSLNADLYQNYQNGVPVSVTAFNTPIAVRQRVNADIGVFATDTWHVKRLAVTGGLRFEYEKSSIEPSAIPGGRFIGPRSFARINCDTIKGLGCWKTFAPRIGAVYDLFGNGKTAIKGGFGKYNTPQATGYLTNFNPMSLSTDTRSWKDLNGDGIAQDNEIGPSTNPNFGKLTNVPQLDRNFKREYNLQYSAGVQHQIRPGASVGFNWYRRTNHDASVIVNRAVDPVNDWSPLTITDPLTGSPTTIYNLNKTAFGRPTDFYQTNDPESKRRSIYTGYEMSFVGRIPHKGTLLAAYTIDRITDVTCSAPIGSSNIGLLLIDGNNITNTSLNDPNSLRNCDERGLIPFRGEVKIIGNIPIWKGFAGSVVYQNAPEFLRYVNWDITKATRYPADCSACPSDATNSALKALVVGSSLTNTTERVALSVPGSRYNDRLNQLDLGIRRNFVFKEKYRLQAQFEVFNVTNANTVLVQNQSLFSTIKPFVLGGPGGLPTQILQARLVRLAMQFHF